MNNIIKNYDECKQLSRFVIAMNPNRNGNKGVINSFILDYYKELTRQPWLSQLVGQIRDLTQQQNELMAESVMTIDERLAGKVNEKDEQVKLLTKQIEGLKKQLPFRSPHYFHFLDDHRAQKSIDPEAFTFQTTIDIDDPEEVENAVKYALLLNGVFMDDVELDFKTHIFKEEDIERWQGKVLHIERSARNKAHIDIRIPVGMTIAEAQADFCRLIRAKEDTSCITPERIIFITDAASEIYIADDWYKRLPDEKIAEYREAYRKRGLDIDGRPFQSEARTRQCGFATSSSASSASVSSSTSVSSLSSSASAASSASSSSSEIPSVDFQPIESEEEKARKAASEAERIAAQGFRGMAAQGTEGMAAQGVDRKAEEPQFEQTYDGVPYAEIVKALVELMGGAPAHGARNNFIYREACLLRYICNSEAAWIKEVILTFGEDEQKAFATVESACKTNQMAVMPDIVRQAVELARKRFLAQQATEKAGIYADVPPQMPDRLPRLIKLLTSKVPADFKPAIACAVFPSLAAHLKGVNFRYIDNQVHEAALMNLLVAPMSSGKSLVNGPIDCIMQDMVVLDQINRDKEQEWKDEVNTMGDNKKKPVRPDNICIRIVSPDLTRAAYIQRLDDAQKAGDAYLYCKMDEVDMLKKFNDPSQLIRLCWDNSVDGQERVGSKSVTARVKTRFNWNASSTIAVTQKFFSIKEVADGAVSRLNLCTIIRDDFAPRPVVGEYDGTFKAALRPYIDCLNGAHGVVDCKKARQLAERLEAEIMETAQLADNKSYAEFAKRALANGYRKAMVLYLANGEKWEKSIEDFIEWSVKYDLWCKMRFFGMKMDEAIDSDRRLVSHSGPSNLLSFVHDTFSLMDIQAVYQMQGKKGRLSSLLAMWVKRGHIMKNADGTYSKTERFIAKYGRYGTPIAA